MAGGKIIDAMASAVRPVRNRIATFAVRALVKLVDDTTLLQLLQLDAGDEEEEDLHDEVPRFQQYGYTSVPQLDNGSAEAIVVFLGGDRSNPIVLAVDDQAYRLAGLQPGEVALYTDEDEPDADPEVDRHYILLKRGRITVLKADEIHLGKDDQGVVIDQKLKDYINDQIVAKLSGHTHTIPVASVSGPGVMVTPGNTGAGATIEAPGDIASSKAKAAE
jgi:phage gp45-like